MFIRYYYIVKNSWNRQRFLVWKYNFASFLQEETLLDILLHKYSDTSTYEGFMLFIFLITLMEVVTEFESSFWDIQHPKDIANGIYLTF